MGKTPDEQLLAKVLHLYRKVATALHCTLAHVREAWCSIALDTYMSHQLVTAIKLGYAMGGAQNPAIIQV